MGLLVSLFYIVYLLVFLHLCHCILKPPTCVWVHPTLRTDTYFFYLYIFYRPSAIPGPIPDELVVPTTNSIGIICSNVLLVIFELIYVPLIVCYILFPVWTGVTLLMKMGWRQGRSIKDSHADSLYGMPSVYLKKYAFFSIIHLFVW